MRDPQIHRRVGLSSIKDLFALRLADTTATIGSPSSWPLLSEFKSRIDRVVETGEALSLKDLAVNGDDLAALGIPRNREMGALLSELSIQYSRTPHSIQKRSCSTLQGRNILAYNAKVGSTRSDDRIEDSCCLPTASV